jgi:hypothetical protein
MLARMAEAGGLELPIFTRDGRKVGRGPRADPRESPSADIVNEFPREQDGRRYQSIPVAVFYTHDLRYLSHYIEVPAIYHKERLAAAMQRAREGETGRAQTWPRFLEEWRALQTGPFFPIWASAMVDEILSALHERIVVGSLGRPAPAHT